MLLKKKINDALKLISSKSKKDYIGLIFLNFLNILMDILTLATIYPLISSIIGNQKTKIDLVFENFISYLGFNLDNKLSILFYFFIILILFKNLILIYIKFRTTFVIEQIFKETSENLFVQTLSRNYLFFANQNQPVLLKNLREIPIEFKNYLDVSLDYYVSLLNILIIGISLIIFDPLITILVLVYAFITSFIYKKLFINRAKIWGAKGNNIAGHIYSHVLDTINLIHEIKLHNKVNFFYKKHKELSDNWSFLIFLKRFITSTSRPVFEIFLIIPLLFITIISSTKLVNINILPLMSVYIYAAFRVLPSLVNLNTAKLKKEGHNFALEYLNNDRFFKEGISKEKNFNEKGETKKIKYEKNLVLKNIDFKYSLKEDFVIKNLNLEIKKNEFIGIKGESGSGKTSLIKIILGLLEPTNGNILIDNKNNINECKIEYMNSISYVPQNLSLLNDTILNNIAFGINKEDVNLDKVWNSLSLASAKNFVNKLEEKLNFVISTNGQNLSGGQAQRIAIARALYHEPKIVILDEATNSLDLNTEKNFYEDLIKLKGHVTIINISHKDSNLEFCDKVYEFSNSRVKISL